MSKNNKIHSRRKVKVHYQTQQQKLGNHQFTFYYLNNNIQNYQKCRKQCIPNLSNKTFSSQPPLSITRKYQNMRYLIQKINDITKPQIQNQLKNKQISKSQSTSFKCQKKQPFIIHKFLKSKRLMVTSAIFQKQKKIDKQQKILCIQRQKQNQNTIFNKKSGRKYINSKLQFEYIKNQCKQKQRLANFFQKRVISQNKFNPFQMNHVKFQHSSLNCSISIQKQQKSNESNVI